MSMNFSIEEFNKALQNSGIDKKLSDITDTVATQLNSIVALDVSAESPSTLKSTLQSSTDAIADITNVLHNATAELAPQLTSLQEKMGEILSGSAAVGQLQALIDSVSNDIDIPSVETLQQRASDSITSIQQTALDALRGQEDDFAPGGTWSDASGAIRAQLNQATTSITGSAFDPGSLFENIVFKTEPTFDEDGIQNGERVVAQKLGKAPVQPVKDALSDVDLKPFEIKQPAEIVKNKLLEDKGTSIATLSTVINKFKERIATDVVFDESTGENIVFVRTIDEDGAEITLPAGFASKSDFEESFVQARNAAQGMMQKNAGELRKFVGDNTEVAQDTFERLSKIASTLPTSELSGGNVIKFERDPITGLAVNPENALNAFGPTIEAAKKASPGIEDNLKELSEKFKKYFTQLGKELPPGQEPEPFDEPEEGAE